MPASRDIMRDEEILHATVSGITLTSADYERIAAERKANPLKHVDHVGLACRDAAATRRFYEDILGLPLANTIVLDDPFRTDGAKYCHFFFEMANGDYIAFFDHIAEFKPSDFEAKSGFHLHFAFEVETDAQVQAFRSRLEDAGIETQFVDHGMYHSLYFRDPNDILLEITFKTEGTAEFESKARKVARKLFDQWLVQRPEFVSALDVENGK